MEREANQLCPWCQTEITWDPEIGAEDECPHCLNQLGGYRSLTFTVKDKTSSGTGAATGETALDREFDDWDDEEENFAGEDASELKEGFAEPARSAHGTLYWDGSLDDAYSEQVQHCVDLQEEAPECIGCRELMLLAGHRELGADFKPHQPEILAQPFLQVPVRLDVYVCPNCFRTETMLSEEDRLKMIQAIKEK